MKPKPRAGKLVAFLYMEAEPVMERFRDDLSPNTLV
jgi:hypothetical protein